jgi:alkylation response protein AidB-like acyl-CoA dehydrogenase
MDFGLTAVQDERLRRVRLFAREALPATPDRPGEPGFCRDRWDRASAFGLAGLPIPVKWGGGGLDALDIALVLEALGGACEDSSLMFSLCAHMFAAAVPVWRAGSDEQKERFLGPMATGRWVGANAATEAEAGSDLFAMQATAVRRGADYVLSGRKCHVTNAPVADVFLVYARTGDGPGPFGMSGFLVTRGAPGLSVEPEPPKTGLTNSPWGTIQLMDCRVPASQRLGEEGAAGAIFQDAMDWERVCLFATWVGTMERVLERCVRHAMERHQFGRPIGAFQGVSHRLADMKLRLETSRLLVYRSAWLLREGKPCGEAAALAKLWVSESAVQLGLDAVQVFGAAGVTESTGVGTLLRDALPLRIASGTSEVMRGLIARHMGIR